MRSTLFRHLLALLVVVSLCQPGMAARQGPMHGRRLRNQYYGGSGGGQASATAISRSFSSGGIAISKSEADAVALRGGQASSFSVATAISKGGKQYGGCGGDGCSGGGGYSGYNGRGGDDCFKFGNKCGGFGQSAYYKPYGRDGP